MQLDAEQQRGLTVLASEAERAGLSLPEKAAFLATAWLESTWRPSAKGDVRNGQPTSFGLFQNRAGGAGGPTIDTANDFLDPVKSARERASQFKRRRIDTGTEAAALQRPATPGTYAANVNKVITNLLSGKAPDGSTFNGTARAANPTKWLRGDTAGIDPNLAASLAWVGQQLGKPIDIVSGKRTRAEQAKLYADYRAGRGNLAAPPGKSNHEQGDAADAYVNGVPLAQFPGATAKLKQAGVQVAVKGEPWHAELTDAAKKIGGAFIGGFVDGFTDPFGSADKLGLNPFGNKVDDAKKQILFVGVVIAAVVIGGLMVVGGSWRAVTGTSAVNVATTVASGGKVGAK